MQNILKQIRKADTDFNLINDDDVILVGVSGGKDSMLLIKALSLYQKFDHKRFKLIAVHMDMGFSNKVDYELIDYLQQLHVEYYIEKVDIYEILKHYPKKDGSIDCSRCSNLKRGSIVNIAKKYQANKIVFAHHLDDAIETLFMNMIYGGKLTTFKPLINYQDNTIQFIRPLIYTKEKVIINVVKKEKIPVIVSKCPKDGNSKRSQIKKQLSNFYKEYPSAKQNFHSMLFSENVDLWTK